MNLFFFSKHTYLLHDNLNNTHTSTNILVDTVLFKEINKDNAIRLRGRGKSKSNGKYAIYNMHIRQKDNMKSLQIMPFSLAQIVVHARLMNLTSLIVCLKLNLWCLKYHQITAIIFWRSVSYCNTYLLQYSNWTLFAIYKFIAVTCCFFWEIKFKLNYTDFFRRCEKLVELAVPML